MSCPKESCPYCLGEGTRKDITKIREHIKCPDCHGLGKRCSISSLPLDSCDHDHVQSKPITKKYF